MLLLRDLVDLVVRRVDPPLQPNLVLLVRPVRDQGQLPALVHHLLALHLFELDYFFQLRGDRWVLFY